MYLHACTYKDYQCLIQLGAIAQSVGSLTAGPGIASSIQARFHTFVEIDHSIISMIILLLPVIQEGLDDILNINNVYFETMVSQIYPSELQLNKANASDTEAAFLDLHLSISNGIISTKIYDKRDDFDFEIVNFPFLDGDVPRSTSYGVYISQLIRFARASSYVTDFNTRDKLLTQKLLKQGYRYHKLRKTFSKFYRRYFDLISKFQVGLKSLLRQGLSEPDFYGDLVYKLKKIVGSNNFSAQFIKIISQYKKIGYHINVLQQTACLVVNPITVGNFAFLFNCTPVGRTSDSMMVPT